MAFNNLYCKATFIFICLCIFQTRAESSSDSLQLGRSSFPKGFVFGCASAAYQYEGGAHVGGKGPSIWDTFSHTPGKIADGSNGDVAADSYHRYKEDVKLLKDLGMDSYRFSLSWTRLFPNGSLEGGINKDGIKFYNNLINEMVRNGIKPFATLFHWDLPQALEDRYKGFLSKNIVKDFGDFAELCFKEFGDRVKHWITVNEPWTYAIQGYDTGFLAPGHCSRHIGNCSEGNSATEPYIVGHNFILSHAKAVEIYKKKYQRTQKGIIGITLSASGKIPSSNESSDIKATQRSLDFAYGWFMSPLIKGNYPESMQNLVGSRLPKFTPAQIKTVKGSYDFIGLNYYTTSYVSHVDTVPSKYISDYSHDSRTNETTELNGVNIGPKAASSWLFVYPQGLYDFLLYTKRKYGNPPVFITENGVDEFNNKKISLEKALDDKMRVKFHSDHLKILRNAINAGANVKGYFAWSLLDNFEWNSGYTVRFGLYYVDFNNGTLNRYPKSSVKWFKKILGS